MTKANEKYLLVVSFLEGDNFPKRNKTKLIIEAKFDGEQLATDPVEHNEIVEINQELAWGLDKKSLQLHKLQRSCIKANCFAISESSKENIGYIVIDIRSAPDGIGKPKLYPLLQSKYAKSKPTIKINTYIEEDPSNQDEKLDQNELQINSRPGSAMSKAGSVSSFDEIHENKKLKIALDENEGYFLIGKLNPNSQTYVLTITIAFARNLIRLITNSDQHSTSNFFFMYKFLDNQVTTKPFGDIVSSQINGERSSIRLHTTLDNLKIFFKQLNNLEIFFCSQDRLIAKCSLNWKIVLDNWNKNSLLGNENSIVVDDLIKLEPIQPNQDRNSPLPDINMSPLIGMQIGIFKEQLNESVLSINDKKNAENLNKISTIIEEESINKETSRKSPIPQQTTNVIFQNDVHTVTVDEKPKESIISFKSGPSNNTINQNEIMNYITEEMQLKAAYELQLWKEAREKEFEQQLKKTEAKRFQALADAFKQRDIEREILVQKKLKEYNDLEVLLKKSLNEVEKREKQLAINETQVARLKVDLNREYEAKLVELREASKRVQEKADHQVNLQKTKTESLEEEIQRLKKQIFELEKKYADKENEFSRYKEKENNRPEVKLQSEINLLNLEKIELERKLDAMTKAKNHYKEQWTRALQEIAMIKKKEEANAKALLKKQQLELEQLRLKYLAEENDFIKTDEKELQSLKNEIEKLKLSSNNSNHSNHQTTNFDSDSGINSCLGNLDNIDPNLQHHINRLVEEKETLLRTGVYTNSDAIIVELDKRIKDCLKEAKSKNY